MANQNLVLGIGGLFFRSRDPKAQTAWYAEHFGTGDPMSGSPWQTQAGPTVFCPFKQDTAYFGDSGQGHMVNFRIKDLDAFLAQLEAAGVRIDPERMNESYGKFAWCYDPEGNKIELWEEVEEGA